MKERTTKGTVTWGVREETDLAAKNMLEQKKHKIENKLAKRNDTKLCQQGVLKLRRRVRENNQTNKVNTITTNPLIIATRNGDDH